MPEAAPKSRPHPSHVKSDGPRIVHAGSRTAYAELAITSNFTFLTGASHPDEFAVRAAEMGYRAVAVTDTNTLAGIVRAHSAAKEVGIPLIVGCRIVLADPAGFTVLVYPTDVTSYGRLCRLLTLGKRRSPKAHCLLGLEDLLEHSAGLLAVAVPPARIDDDYVGRLRTLKRWFDDDRLSIAATCCYGPDDAARLREVARLCDETRLPMVAVQEAHYHEPGRRMLQDVVTCIRHGCTLEEAGYRLLPNGERYLKPPEEIDRLFRSHPSAVARSMEIARRASGFSLDQLRYQYPAEVVPEGSTPIAHLTRLTWEGARWRYPQGVPDKVRTQIGYELALIDELQYAHYFLTVHDLVRYARSIDILCQGRGAAANSAVCYCLGVTEVNPAFIDVLFERFVSRERKEPPDIDIDFEHERREEAIQYLYRKYGRDRAALTAEVITYRGRSAVREVGKALGLSLDAVDQLAKNIDFWGGQAPESETLRAMKLDPEDVTIRHFLRLSLEIQGFPRHLGQHVGGFVLTQTPLCELVPIENAAMPDRTVIEWDKDDLDAMGFIKVDVLGLGMLSCLRRGLDLLGEVKRRRDGETERRSVGEDEPTGGTKAGHGKRKDLPGSRGMAEGDELGGVAVCGDEEHACGRAVRPDEPDQAGGLLDPIQHRRGVRSRDASRLSEIYENCERITQRSQHAVRTGNPDGHDFHFRDHLGSDRRNRSRSARLDQEPGAQELKDAAPSGTSSLRLSVSSSLSPPSSLGALLLHQDPAVYDMICRADTIGVFQIESRAQMSMLPRLRPRCYYDLVIEVAIVRPGPIQGNMVHPYLRRRMGKEPVTYASPAMERILKKTLGVPLFQEQAMQLAIDCAGFTPDEADKLRRAVTGFRRYGDLDDFEARFIDGMTRNGYERSFAERCFEQIRGFSSYGFPESHSASFAILVYASAWLKCHYPEVFACALLNSQPMGFYAPAQIVIDAQRHGVEVRPVDVHFSQWECTLEEGAEGGREATKRRSDGATEGAEGHESTEARRHGGAGASPCTPDECPGHAAPERSEGADACHDDQSSLTFDRPSPHAPSSLRRFVAPSLRLGMNRVKGLRQDDAEKIARAVAREGRFTSIEALWKTSGATARAMRLLAGADAFGSMGLDRQSALWHARKLRDEEMPLFEYPPDSGGGAAQQRPVSPAAIEDAGHGNPAPAPIVVRRSLPPDLPVPLPKLPELRHVVQDYGTVGLSLRKHPFHFLRPFLQTRRAIFTKDLADPKRYPSGRGVTVAGLCLVRQRPGTSKGIVFMTIEDETGVANLVVRPQVYERFRAEVRGAGSLLVRGRIDRAGEVVHVVATSMESLDDHLTSMRSQSRDFH